MSISTVLAARKRCSCSRPNARGDRAARCVTLLVSTLLVCIGVVTSAAAGTEQPTSVRPPLERIVRELGKTGAESLIVFVSDGDKEYVATAGSRRPGAEQRFRVGSVTKTFTATIVLQLVDEGKLQLDSTLQEHLPGVVPRGGEITIRHLLTHRSGLRDVTEYPKWLKEAEQSPLTSPISSLRYAASKPLAFAPGSQEHYSNTNYIALGLVFEKVTGRPYAEELEQRVLEPLGLSRTELPKTRRLPDLADAGSNPNLFWAAGAIVSNAHDVARFYSALLSGRLLSSASLARMKTTVDGMGLGIWAAEMPCGRAWGHDGRIDDYQTLVYASETGDRVAVASLRGPAPIPPLGRALFCAEAPLAAGSSSARSRLAFISTSRTYPAPLYVANADGTGQGWLTLTATSFTWAPDGRRIAFESLRDGNSEIYVMTADGSRQRNLTRRAAEDIHPLWSPDGRRIAFLSLRDGNPEIYVMNADGSRQRNLTRNAAPELDFAWSPDGRRIAFLSKRDGAWKIYVMNADGSRPRSLTRNAEQEFQFDWSPDGRRIAFVSKRDGTRDLYVINDDGSEQRRLTRNANPGEPAWSPDGRKIAFDGARHGNQDIYVINPSGGGLRRLTRNPAWDGGASWSPGGGRIAFHSNREGNNELFVMNADGSGPRNVTRSPWDEIGGAWSPAPKR